MNHTAAMSRHGWLLRIAEAGERIIPARTRRGPGWMRCIPAGADA